MPKYLDVSRWFPVVCFLMCVLHEVSMFGWSVCGRLNAVTLRVKHVVALVPVLMHAERITTPGWDLPLKEQIIFPS